MNTQTAARFIGVPTTTPVAFQSAGILYLERMSILASDGCGVLCGALPLVGEELPLVFRLSTNKDVVRCRARVEGLLPTTPAGLQLAATLGEKGLHAATSGTMGDSATMMFRLSDMQDMAKAAAQPAPARTGKAVGFCVRFLDLGVAEKERVQHHITVSRKLGDQLAARGGASSGAADTDRNTAAVMFSDGELSSRAKDW